MFERFRAARSARTSMVIAPSSPALRPDPELPTDREGLDNHGLVLVMAARLDADSTFVDLGANEGRFLHAARRLAPHGRHFAFEPLPELAEQLVERFPEVTVHNVALGAEDGLSEFVRVLDDRGYSGLAEQAYPGAYATERLEVRLARLDDLIPEDVVPSFVKIDVEGAELGALRGAINTLRRARPWVAFEHGLAARAFGTEPGDIHDLLCREVGLQIFDLDGQGPMSRQVFEDCARSNTRWNWFARP